MKLEAHILSPSDECWVIHADGHTSGRGLAAPRIDKLCERSGESIEIVALKRGWAIGASQERIAKETRWQWD